MVYTLIFPPRCKTMNIEEISRKLAQKWTEEIGLDDLMSFFYNSQIQYLADLPDADVLNLAIEADIIEDTQM